MIKISSQFRLTTESLRVFSNPARSFPRTKTHWTFLAGCTQHECKLKLVNIHDQRKYTPSNILNDLHESFCDVHWSEILIISKILKGPNRVEMHISYRYTHPVNIEIKSSLCSSSGVIIERWPPFKAHSVFANQNVLASWCSVRYPMKIYNSS